MSGVFDREQVRRAASRARHAGRDDFLLERMAESLRERLFDIKRDFPVAVEISPQRMILDQDFCARKNIAADVHLSSLDGMGVAIIDEEILPLAPQSCDALIHIGALHWVNDVPGTLIQMRHALKPDGVMLAAFFGGETLTELRDIVMRVEARLCGGVSPRVSPFVALNDMAALMQRAQFALPVVDYERVTVTYQDVKSLFRDLRRMGQGHAVMQRDKRILPKHFWAEVEREYRAHFVTGDGRLTARFDLFYAIGWAPHESQQKPLKPGSAVHRLADLLQTEEKGTGDFV